MHTKRVLIEVVLVLLVSSGTGALAKAPSLAVNQQAVASRVAPASAPVDEMASKLGAGDAFDIHNQAEFDRLARVYDAGTAMALPHVLFVVDRGAALGRDPKTAHMSAQMLFIHTPRYQLHERYLRETNRFTGSRALFELNYTHANRRFILGTLSLQPQLKAYVYEFWEGDQVTSEMMDLVSTSLAAHFFAPVVFKANSLAQEVTARAAKLPMVTQAQLLGQQRYWALNQGQAVGRLRMVDLETVNDLQPTDIVVLQRVPLQLPPVAGVIMAQPSTMLSHVNMLAKAWNIPNAYLRNASQQLAAWNGQWVHLTVAAQAHTVRPATAQERALAQRAPRKATQLASAVADPSDVQSIALKSLGELRAQDRVQCGAKAANLGEVQAARLVNVMVPDGFCVPFGAYALAMQKFGLSERIAKLNQIPAFDESADVRRQALAQLRSDIENMPLDDDLSAMVAHWQTRWMNQLGGVGVFVRSSSNAEDLLHFNGAGLYTTVPNINNATALTQAIRRVWASVFNFEAWEARRAAGISQEEVVMAVLIQRAVDAQAAGVMVTRSPLGRTPDTVQIAAKRGLGIRVVDGVRVAEQVLYTRESNAVKVLSQSDERSALQLAPDGGVRDVPLDPQASAVLSELRVKRLAEVGWAIERLFGGKAQDIEWALMRDDEQHEQVIVLQARPFAP